jgi:glucose-6-phosphate 1-dehydrogenase
MATTVPPCAAVIFGAGGDLNKRKLIPALLNLASAKLLPDGFAVVAMLRQETSDEAFRDQLGKAVKELSKAKTDEEWTWLAPRVHVCWGEYHDASTYARLGELLGRLEKERGTEGNAMFYLATPPNIFGDIVKKLGAAGLAKEQEGKFRRVIVEKPFGTDLESARALTLELRETLREKQIYRIDHYLGKETVQNIMAMRFANGIFEPIWNHNYVEHVQITTGETVGVEGRGGYYEESGALRDMVPNHLLQLLALIAMEPPVSFEAEAIRDEKAKALRAIQPMDQERVLRDTVRGQYGEGMVGTERAPGYRQEPKVNPRSATETFVALRLKIDNWRWAGTPFYIRTGKRLAKRVTEIVVQFKRAPFTLFRSTECERLSPNLLIIHIQPKEGMSLRFAAKVPGATMKLSDVDMEFKYADFFGQKPSTGYETLLYDCMHGDATLFQRADNIEAGWAVVQPLLDVWKALPPRDFPNYAAGSWGPKAADDLLERDGRAWRKQ